MPHDDPASHSAKHQPSPLASWRKLLLNRNQDQIHQIQLSPVHIASSPAPQAIWQWGFPCLSTLHPRSGVFMCKCGWPAASAADAFASASWCVCGWSLQSARNLAFLLWLGLPLYFASNSYMS